MPGPVLMLPSGALAIHLGDRRLAAASTALFRGGWNGLPAAGAGWARCWVSEGTGDGASDGAGPGTSAGLGPVVTVVAAGLVPSVS